MASKTFLHSLEKSQILKAVVEEVTSRTTVLCNFHGELLLINNHTGKNFKVGDPVRLQVVSSSPLQFQIFDSQSKRFERVV